MGIKKLNKFLRDKNLVIIHDNIGQFIRNKRQEYNTNGNIVIAIDLLLYLYKYTYAYDSFIIGFWNQLSFLLSHRIIPFYIIDNKYPEEKISIIKARCKKKNNLENRLETIKIQLENVKNELNINDNIINFLNSEKDKLEKRIIKIKKNDIELMKEFLNDLNIPYANADSEADMLCSKLYKEGYIISCLSDDMDMLCFGCNSVIQFSNNTVIEFNLDIILKGLELTKNQFVEMCILFGCDYLKPNFKIDIHDIYKNIKKYGTFTEIIRINIYPNFNDERSKYFIEKFDNIKNLFINYADNNEIKMPSITEELNLSKVLYYLNEYRYNEIIKNEKHNIEKCVNYINNHINNKLLYNNPLFKYKKKQ